MRNGRRQSLLPTRFKQCQSTPRTGLGVDFAHGCSSRQKLDAGLELLALRLKRALIFTHRWLGIPLSLMIVVWFASGIAMIYLGGMPRIGPQARLDHLPVLDVSRIRLSPSQAAERIGGEDAAPGAPVLAMVQGRPAYRFRDADNATVYADDGTVMAPVDQAAAARVAVAFLREPAAGLAFDRSVDSPDQWTPTLRGTFPLLKFAANDSRGTELYVSTITGEVAQATTRADRAAAWISTIPHWLYFSAAAAEPAALVQDRGVALRARVRADRAGPHPRVHAVSPPLALPTRHALALHRRRALRCVRAHVGVQRLGVDGADGLARRTGDPRRPIALAGGEVDLHAHDNVQANLPGLVAPRYLKEIAFTRIQGQHFLSLRTSEHADAKTLPLERLHAPYDIDGRGQDAHVLVNAATAARRDGLFAELDILEHLNKAQPHRIVSSEVLYDYDDYYYSRSRQTPLPVVRAKLDDPLQSWIYLDMRTSQVVANVHKYSRIERWLYSGLHSLDFRFWYAKRPWWDLGMIVLLLGGLVGSSLGLYYGVRRLVRSSRRSRELTGGGHPYAQRAIRDSYRSARSGPSPASASKCPGCGLLLSQPEKSRGPHAPAHAAALRLHSAVRLTRWRRRQILRRREVELDAPARVDRAVLVAAEGELLRHHLRRALVHTLAMVRARQHIGRGGLDVEDERVGILQRDALLDPHVLADRARSVVAAGIDGPRIDVRRRDDERRRRPSDRRRCRCRSRPCSAEWRGHRCRCAAADRLRW